MNDYKSLLIFVFLSSFSTSVFAQTYSRGNVGVYQSSQCALNYFFKKSFIASPYLKSSINHQRKIWNLQRSGSYRLASDIEDELLKKISQDSYVGVYPLHIGKSGAKLIVIDKYASAIFKSVDGARKNFKSIVNMKSEVAAYKLDRALGFNFVPITTIREVEGSIGSIQLYYSKAKAAAYTKVSKIRKFETEKLELFDYLIGNRDRNPQNYLVGESGRVIAIDHGLSFIGSEVLKPMPSLREYFLSAEGRKVMKALQSVPDQSIRNILRTELSSEAIEIVLQRRRNIISFFN